MGKLGRDIFAWLILGVVAIGLDVYVMNFHKPDMEIVPVVNDVGQEMSKEVPRQSLSNPVPIAAPSRIPKATYTAPWRSEAVSGQDTALTLGVNKPNCSHFISLEAEDNWANQIIQYAYFYGLIRQHNLGNFSIEDSMKTSLLRIFPKISLPMLSEANCTMTSFTRIPGQDINATRLLTDLEESPGTNYLVSKAGVKIQTFVLYRQELAYEFQLRPYFENLIRNDIQDIKLSFPNLPPRPIMIGVHVRRHSLDPKKEYLSSEAYYLKAMKFVKRRYGPSCLFVVIADNHQWATIHLSDRSDVFIAHPNSHPDISQDQYEFMLLSRMTHLIISHGQMGYMAAFLVDGDVTIPDSYKVGYTSPAQDYRVTGLASRWQFVIDPELLSPEHENPLLSGISSMM